MKRIEYNKVTWYSKLIALILFVSLPFIGFYFGVKYSELKARAKWLRDNQVQYMPSSIR